VADFVNTWTAGLRPLRTADDRQTVAIDQSGRIDRAITTIDIEAWRRLSERAVEPNAYYLPDWALAVDASARDRGGMSALSAWQGDGSSARLTGLIPVVQMRRAFGILFPALVSADPYGNLGTPMIDRDHASSALASILATARRAGAHALILRDTPIDGPLMTTLTAALSQMKLRPRVLQSHKRALLDATRDADEVLREGLGAKKLKELRRQRNRLAEHGDVTFNIVRAPDAVHQALDQFLELEASGWKARRGTALKSHAGDATFIRRAVTALVAHGQCELVTLQAGTTPVAAAIILRHLDRAFYFKIGVDESFAKLSPGVQLTLDVTRYLCADPQIRLVDSTAAPGHPMIDPIWRGRLPIGDILIPLRRFDPVVPLIVAALSLRRAIREPLVRVARFIRKQMEKSQ
jgi:CelD/BcsL family acetyltransferase involved in cellulose biosynthesis